MTKKIDAKSSLIIVLFVLVGFLSGLYLSDGTQKPDLEYDSIKLLDGKMSSEKVPAGQVKAAANPFLSNDASIQQIQVALQQERNARLELAKQIKKLQQQIDAITRNSKSSEATSNNADIITDEADPSDSEQQTWFNDQVMLDAGLSRAEVSQLHTKYEEIEMQKLYLRDRAVREGWRGTPRYMEEFNKLEDQFDAMHAQIGDNAYDAMLFATGQPNRVVVQDVLDNSPAKQAGMQAGDMIMRYGDGRIFNWTELRSATQAGTPEEIITVDLIRNGHPIQVYVPRGPLGIRMDMISSKP
jgi:C-terminal processing protease CtpA/Prc